MQCGGAGRNIAVLRVAACVGVVAVQARNIQLEVPSHISGMLEGFAPRNVPPWARGMSEAQFAEALKRVV